ncbi:MAG: hypothetical protein M0R30_01980 [Methanoregula sp.]|jgi:hypothetical protein|uniref:hypothetical protein n=1 Tax=Methanoregula sp. TaxID=2052170 RepID=UPI0025D53F90|nr:hypothetical protein [Methanoregula sp.]MCK9630384.1 hypothetical protein [Methanoregula sp.]
MRGSVYTIVAGLSVLFVVSLCAGCLSTEVGDTRYDNRSVLVSISHAGDPVDVHIQVTVNRIAGLAQEQYTIVSAPATLVNGENLVFVPVELKPGSYKLFVYVLHDGDRRTAVIRDIVV